MIGIMYFNPVILNVSLYRLKKLISLFCAYQHSKLVSIISVETCFPDIWGKYYIDLSWVNITQLQLLILQSRDIMQLKLFILQLSLYCTIEIFYPTVAGCGLTSCFHLLGYCPTLKQGTSPAGMLFCSAKNILLEGWEIKSHSCNFCIIIKLWDKNHYINSQLWELLCGSWIKIACSFEVLKK